MTTRDYSTFLDGLRKFVRLIPLRQDPRQKRYIQDELDLLVVLDSVRAKFMDTAEMFGKKKYRDTPFDFCEDVREELEEWLFVPRGEDLQQAAVLRKKYQPMYFLVIVPVIDMFETMKHGQALLALNEILAEVTELIMNHEYDGTYDDALVTQAVINNEIRTKEQQRQAKIKRRRSKASIVLDDAVELMFD